MTGHAVDNGCLELRVLVDEEGRASVTCGSPGAPTPPGAVPLAEVTADGEGQGWSGTRAVSTVIGNRLTTVDVAPVGAAGLTVRQRDDRTGLLVTTTLVLIDGHAAFRTTTSVRNGSSAPVLLRSVTSLVIAGFTGSGGRLDGIELIEGRNDWLGENRWQRGEIRAAGLADLYGHTHPDRPLRLRGAVRATSTSSWSTAEQLPVGALVDTGSGTAWMWQIEHNGAWSWQVGELADGLFLALSGPNDTDHQWNRLLAPGETFESVPVTVAVSHEGFDRVVAEMTGARRAARVVRDVELPVVFNDYMNTLMGDPTADRLHPLVDAAAEIGADVFVIDAGWYADDGDWWDAVGEWQPSTRRFPDGIDAVLDHIRDRGMVAGLWLEPEVVGLRSPIAEKLPEQAFLSRGGHRVVEDGRYHLDLAHPAAREHLDEVVDRLVDDHGVGYFKLDYNIRAGVGTDRDVTSPGDGLLRHNRAHLAWIDSVRARHPQLLLENCASGAMRQDHAQLQRHDLQSTSDQEDADLYAPIAAGAPMSVVPDQAANWAYPQPTMTDEQIVFTLVTGLTGRLYLSGFLDGLSSAQRSLVEHAVVVHRSRRDLLRRGVPTWPLGFPRWDDPWVASGLVDPVDGVCSVNIWRRAGASHVTRLHLPSAPAGRRWTAVRQVFPIAEGVAPWSFALDEAGGWLDVGCTDDVASARVVMVTSGPPD